MIEKYTLETSERLRDFNGGVYAHSLLLPLQLSISKIISIKVITITKYININI